MILLEELKIGPSPVMAAPLAGYHDPPAAKILASLGVRHMVYPFVSSEGLMKRKAYRIEVTAKLLEWRKNIKSCELHIQIFGSTPDVMSDAASYLESDVGADIININMGCSVRKIWKAKSGSLLLKEPELALKIIEDICSRVKIPVILKTRTGWDENDINGLEIIRKACDAGIAAAILHPRRGKDKFQSKANWNEIAQAVKISKVPIIGNGDIKSSIDAKRMLDETGAKGIMIGRASIGNPWIFNQTDEYLHNGVLIEPPSESERIDMCLCHIDELVDSKGEEQGIKESRKHIGRYLKGLPDATTIRYEVVNTDDYQKVKYILSEYKKHLRNRAYG